LQHFFVGENLERFATDRYNDPRPVWFYLPVLAGGLLPWSPFLLLLAPPLAGVLKGRRTISTVTLRLAIWAAIPLLFYTASVGKQPRYILPVMPPLAILLGRAISARLSRQQPDRLLNACTVITAVLLLLVPFGLWRMNDLLEASGYSGVTGSMIGLLIVAGLLPLLAVAAGARRSTGHLVAMGAAIALVTLEYALFSQVRPGPVERMAAAVRAERTADEPLATYNVFERNLIFYTRFRQADIFSEEALVGFLRSPYRVLCVLNRSDLDRITRDQHLRLRLLFEVRDFDPAQIRLDTVLFPDPSRAIETAVLVSNR
jgi:4-amino-4-deoxy-L-arabinose transferase-like glycosyltransferase